MTFCIALLRFLYQQGLWLSWPLVALGVFVAWVSISTVARLGEENRICVLPLTVEQVVEFDEAGRVELWLEGPLLSTRFAGLSFELTGSDGRPLKGRGSWFGQHSSSLSRARFLARSFTVPQPGRYVLRTRGLAGAQPSDEDHDLVFMRPYLSRTVGCVLGIILGAFLVIGGLVTFSLRLLSMRS